MKRIQLMGSAILASAAFPLLALAQGVNTAGLRNLLDSVLLIVNTIVLPVLLAIIVVYMIIGAFQFATSGGDEEKRKAAQSKLIWGLVGVVLIFAIYSLVGIASGIFTWSAGAIPPPNPIQIP